MVIKMHFLDHSNTLPYPYTISINNICCCNSHLLTTRRGDTSTCPGWMGFKFTKAMLSSVCRKISAAASVCIPNSRAIATRTTYYGVKRLNFQPQIKQRLPVLMLLDQFYYKSMKSKTSIEATIVRTGPQPTPRSACCRRRRPALPS